MADLSILIPARNEMFLKNTVEDILSHIEGDTEVLVGLDGQWANPSLIDNPRVIIIYRPQSIGQRAMTNELCRLSKAKYVMKVDAHCAFDQGFDVKMMKEMHDDWTMIPTLYNLHVFDWVCKCGHRRYQGPSDPCEKCGAPMEREMVWKPRLSRKSTHYRFDATLHFQYWNDLRKRPGFEGEITETMSAQGSCFMLTREKYWELDICDEGHGSWGQQGTEVACKTWLSGGKLVTNTKTWYSHLFRTQGRDFGFPYPQDGNQVDHARKYSRELWIGNKWPKAKHDLNWLITKFSPVPDWPDPAKVTKGIIFYTDNQLNLKIAHKVQKQLSKISQEKNIPIVSASLKPMVFGKNIYLPLQRGWLTMVKQILAALEASTADVIFFCEHDVLYDPSHFDFLPPQKDMYYYNENVWQVRASDGHALYYDCKKLSQLCAYRELLIKHYKERIRRIEAEGFKMTMGHEPGTHNRKERIDDFKAESWRSSVPNIDIRHDTNATSSRWRQDQFRDQRNCQNWKESEANLLNGWSSLTFPI